MSTAGLSFAQEVETGVIRLGGKPNPSIDIPTPRVESAKRSFDFQSFETRLDSLWFQRKALSADGRFEDAAAMGVQIGSFSDEEGVHQLSKLSGALLRETERWIQEGNFDQAMATLELAESFDAGHPQIHRARAAVHWNRGDHLAAIGDWFRAQRAAVVRSVGDLSLLNRMAFLLLIAVLVSGVVFGLTMVFRYQIPFRHEVEEWVVQRMPAHWSRPLGWAVLLAPLVLWFAAGWMILYWIAACYRFMKRGERIAAVVLVLLLALSVPAYRVIVGLYGMSSDPVVQHTVGAADGAYSPERILEIEALAESYPEDPVYQFLLAGLYKNGRYFEEAFASYRRALELDPTLEQAYVNVGNIFYTTGQFSEAIAQYNHAIEVQPKMALAYFNRHLAQSEAFDFDDSRESLAKARAIDSKQVAAIMQIASGDTGERSTVLDADLETGSVWRAALEGRKPRAWAGEEPPRGSWLTRQFLNPITIVSILLLGLFAALTFFSDPESVARRCIRCGGPFCLYCKSGREGHEYCSQCHHLFVLGDGLAPEAKSLKLYEVERHERWTRSARKALSWFLPGMGALLRGHTLLGFALVVAWFVFFFAWQPVALQPLGALLNLDLRFDLLGTASLPAVFTVQPLALVGIVGLVSIWLGANVRRRRRGVA